MRRISFGLVVLFVMLGATACSKPSTDDCRKALMNMRSILGTDSPTTNHNLESDIRSCKGGSSKKAVECAIKATTLEDLNACDFMKGPRHKGSGSADTGSAAAGSDVGSATAGSGAGGSTTTGSGDGSANGDGSATGSGDGSATGSDGSAAPGSAAGGN